MGYFKKVSLDLMTFGNLTYVLLELHEDRMSLGSQYCDVRWGTLTSRHRWPHLKHNNKRAEWAVGTYPAEWQGATLYLVSVIW